MASDRLWILGASDPEMVEIEALLRECGERVEYATRQGRRVTPGDMYRADLPLCVPGVTEYVWVECDHDPVVHPAEVTESHIDHHRPGDPGFGRPPAEFLAGSSIGQVIQQLGILDLIHRTGWIGGVETGIGETLTEGALAYGCWGTETDGVDGLECGSDPNANGPEWVVGCSWGCHRGYVIPPRLVMLAAADHCLAAAYRGECPGVDPDTLLRWRVETRAAHQGRTAEQIRAAIDRAREALRRAPIEQLGPGVAVRDMRQDDVIPELPEASCLEGMCFLSTVTVSDGKKKVVCQSGSPGQIQAFLETWAPAHGLVDTYGDPARGFAGGYLAT